MGMIVPRVVKISGYGGIVFWSLMSLLFGINLLSGVPDGSTAADTQFDRVALPIFFGFSLAGIVVSLGLIRAKLWAYRVSVAVLAGLAPAIGLTALLGKELSRRTAAVVVVCACGMFLLRLLLRDSVRKFFGLPPKGIDLLREPGWWSLGMGAIGLPLLFWPVPTPLFGVWLNRWSEFLVGLVFTAGNIALGLGLLTWRRWVWPVAIVLALSGVLYSVGAAWEAPNRQSALKASAFGLALSSWTLRRIWRHRAGSVTASLSH
jgi:uncharacterized membrane protein